MMLCLTKFYVFAINTKMQDVGCRTRNAEATLVAGTLPSVFDPTKDLYFPDWLGVDTCINDGTGKQALFCVVFPPHLSLEQSSFLLRQPV